MKGRRHISSDTSAKIGGVAVVLIVLGASLIAVGCAVVFSDRSEEKTYEVTISVDAMGIANADGYVYNVCKQTSAGSRYYNPHAPANTDPYTLLSPSTEAAMFVSFKIKDVTNNSDTVFRTVSSGTPAEGDPIVGNTVTFTVKTGESSLDMVIFLNIRDGQSTPDGSIADIYGSAPGEQGVRTTISLKTEHTQETLKGNEQSQNIGLLKYSVDVRTV